MASYNADGTIRLPGFTSLGGNPCGLGLSAEGVLYVGGQFPTMWSGETGELVHPPGFEGALSEQQVCHITFDNENDAWTNKVTPEGAQPGLYKFGTPNELYVCCEDGFGDKSKLHVSYVPTQYSAVDPGSGDIFAIEEEKQISEFTAAGQPVETFGLGAIGGSLGVAVNGTTHEVYVTSNTGTPRVDIFKRGTPYTVPDATTVTAGHPDGTSGVLRGAINADEVATTECKFEWGTTTQYLNGIVPCDEGDVFTGNSENAVSHEVENLTLGNIYHYRVAAKNANGHWSYGVDRTFEASTAPTTTNVLVDEINTDKAHFAATIAPHGGTTRYRFEIGTEDCAVSTCTVIPGGEGTLESRLTPQEVQVTALGLDPNALYYVRLVVENEAGEVEPVRVFRTYPGPAVDNCGNKAVRQQTGASLLPDCRAYELVSAANAGGYDVESDLVPGQTPFTAHPRAGNRLLYGLHFGSTPGIAGDPPNFGLDPYVAERTANGWVSRYVGIPAEGMADPNPYGSPLLGADQALNVFAFGGKNICSPCFAGEGTNIPVRINGGPAVPGMAGSENPGPSEPAGLVLQSVSDDGSHLLFGTEQAFEQGDQDNELTLYSRNLALGTTEIVSTNTTDGGTLSGPTLAGLGQSGNGAEVVFGKEVGDDGAGHALYHLYMHRAGIGPSVDLTPGVSGGVLFGGMTSDGSKIFFTTTDQLLGEDTDSSADVYEADVSGGSVTLHLVSVKSTGAASNDDSCTPPGSPETWNSATGDGMCGAVAFAGGAGVAASNGTFFFVTPEQLQAGKGEAGEVNLYVVRPGANPEFVATIDSSAIKAPAPQPLHPLEDESIATVAKAEAMTVDQATEDIYVVSGEENKLTRLTKSGGPHNFTAGPGSGTNVISGFSFEFPSGASVAVDNHAGSPFQGDFYVTSKSGEYAGVSVWSPTGEKIGQITGSGTSVGSFTNACGVAVDQSDGSLYIADKGSGGSGHLWRYRPTGSAPVSDADYTVTGIKTTGLEACAVAADGSEHIFASKRAEGPLYRFGRSGFSAAAPGQSGTQIQESAKALAVDPSTHDLYVDEGGTIAILNSAGEQQSSISGAGAFTGSRGVAVNAANQHVYASTQSTGEIAEFGYESAPYHPIDNVGVLHAIGQPETHSYADFQTTPDGRFAVFASAVSLTGYENLGHPEVFRYESEGGAVECASCGTTLAPAKTDTGLSPYGLNLTDDGRVFFTSAEGLVLSDTNQRRDAYEWEGGTAVGKISTGRSSYDSKLLSVSANGVDAYFFTRDVLVPEDENGGAVKVYDAREGGGYPQSSAAPPCAASDECHGPGTPQPPPPNINSLTGAGEQPGTATAPAGKNKKCKKGFVRKHGKCVKKHRKPKRHHSKHRAGSNG